MQAIFTVRHRSLTAVTVLLTLLFTTFPCTGVRAQKSIGFGEAYTFRSETLEEDRTLNVLLPKEYKDSLASNYPVIYLLDGAVDEDFYHVAGLVRYHQDHGMMPPTILVGIANTDRKRDMTFPSSDPRDLEDFPTTGGSAKFIRFLQTELPDFMGENFRTTGHATLIGQSLAGLLVTEVLLTEPSAFNDYIIVSPSLWWDRESLFNRMDSLAASMKQFPSRVFASAGTEYPVMVEGSRKLAELLKNKTDASFLHLPAEDHNTILHEALTRAFDRWYDPTEIRPYYFANKRLDLEVFTAPNQDSALVGRLAYGQSLGLLPNSKPLPGTLDEVPGNWVAIGSDLGRGWAFEAHLSPVPVFTRPETLAAYARRSLYLTDSIVYQQHFYRGGTPRMVIHSTIAGHQLVEHQFEENPQLELRIANVTRAQALLLLENWLSVNRLTYLARIDLPAGVGMFNRQYGDTRAGGGKIVKAVFCDNVLAINQEESTEE